MHRLFNQIDLIATAYVGASGFPFRADAFWVAGSVSTIAKTKSFFDIFISFGPSCSSTFDRKRSIMDPL